MFPTFPPRRPTNAKKRTKKAYRSENHVVHLMGDPTRTASSSSSTTNHHTPKTGYDEDLTHDPPPYTHRPPSPSNLTILDDLGVRESNYLHHHCQDEPDYGGQLPPSSSDGSCTAGFIISDIAAGSYCLNSQKHHHPDHAHHVHDTKKNSKQPTGGHNFDHDQAAGPIDNQDILKDLANVAADTKKSKRREDGLAGVQCGCWPFHAAASRR